MGSSGRPDNLNRGARVASGTVRYSEVLAALRVEKKIVGGERRAIAHSVRRASLIRGPPDRAWAALLYQLSQSSSAKSSVVGCYGGSRQKWRRPCMDDTGEGAPGNGVPMVFFPKSFFLRFCCGFVAVLLVISVSVPNTSSEVSSEDIARTSAGKLLVVQERRDT